MTDTQNTTVAQAAADTETFTQRMARKFAEAAAVERKAVADRNTRLGEILRTDRILRVIDLTGDFDFDPDTGAYVIEVPPFSRAGSDQRNMFTTVAEGRSDRQHFYSRAVATLHALGQLDGDSSNDNGAAAEFAARVLRIDNGIA